MSIDPEKRFRLGAVEVRPDENALIRDGVATHIEPRSMQVLVALAGGGGTIVGRERLVSEVWKHSYVTDDALNRCISNLRTALGDSPREPEYIVTVPRRGYRLAKEVTLLESVEEAVSVLVLPFQNLSEKMERFIADGLTELLIARLSVVLEQPVISRTTAMSFRDTGRDLVSISRQLGARWVVEGSVMGLDGQVQIVVQLIDARTDAHVWAETWTRPEGDLLSILNEISRLVAGRLRSELVESPAPAAAVHGLSAELLRHYLLGIQLTSQRTHDALRRAVACFERVLADEPEHAPSIGGLAMVYFMLAHYGAIDPAEGFGKARQMAQRAMELDPALPEARLHLAAIMFHHDWDFDEAEAVVESCLAINPNLEMALVVAANISLARYRYEQAQAFIDRALRVDPLNIGVLMNAGDHLIMQRRYGEAIRTLSSALEIDAQFRPGCFRLAQAHAYNGQAEEARACLERCRQLGEDDAYWYEYRAIVEGRLGERAEAEAAAAGLQAMADRSGSVLPWSLARAWASAGDEARAIGHLQKAFDMRSSSMPFLGISPVFESIRQRPEVREMLRRIGLPAPE